MNTKISSFADINKLKNCRMIGDPDKISMTNSEITVNSEDGDNLLIFEDGVNLVNSRITINGTGNVVYFSSNRHNYHINLSVNNNNTFFIGRDNYFNGTINIICSESQNVIIGQEGMFSFGIWIRNADPHLIYNIDDKKRINPSRSIYIGDHVWIGQQSLILKGCRIGSGSVVGANSVLSGKRCLSNCVYAGNPAKKVKENIFFTGECTHEWTRNVTKKYMVNDTDMWVYNSDINSIDIDRLDTLFSESCSAEERYNHLKENIIMNNDRNRFCIKNNTGNKNKQIRIQFIGNYLEKAAGILEDKGIKTESIISGLNPLAMVGNSNKKYEHYCSDIGIVPVALNVRKNLAQMLSHSEMNFCSNVTKQPTGTEVRYKNTSDYVVICNSYMAFALFEEDDILYSDIWPRNKMIEELKANKNKKIIRLPFGKDFDWKYYYDRFIETILAEYDSEHIILVKINSAQWYSENGDFTAFGQKSKIFKNAIEQIDDYFEEKTKCFAVNALYSQIPLTNFNNAFPYEVFSEISHKRIADEIYDIITSKSKKERINDYSSPFAKYLIKRISPDKIEILNDLLQYAERNKLISAEELDLNFFSADLMKLKFFLDPEQNNCLSDYLTENETITEEQIKEKLGMIGLYVDYFRTDLNDIIAIYKFYIACTDKKAFRDVVSGLLNKTDFGPVKTSIDFMQKNAEYLRSYKFISEELLQTEIRNKAYIKISNTTFIVLDPSSDEPMCLTVINNEKADPDDLISSGYICRASQAESICSDWKIYIEKGRKGEGTEPFKILFDSPEEYSDSLYYVDYAEILEYESFILTADKECTFADAHAKTDLGFLFDPKTKIAVIANGLADQLAYYIFAELLQEKTNSNVYFYDRTQHFNGREFDRFSKKDIRNKIITNLISEKLMKQTNRTSWSLANTLYENGLTDITMDLGGWCTIHADKAKCKTEIIKNVPEFFSKKSDSLQYIWALYRPDELMQYYSFKMSDYIKFPEFDTDINIELSKKMADCDSVSIHVRRGDFVTVGKANDLQFYKDAVKEIYNISEYKNRKWFIFSDDIAFCRSHISELGLDNVGGEEVIFIDHNKYENSFRDMQLMTYSKVIVGGNSGFSRLAAIYSDRCEVFLYNVKEVMELHKKVVRVNKYIPDYVPTIKQPKKIENRERIEFLNFWFSNGNSERNDRILLIGDSVSREYRGSLEKVTRCPVDFFATSTAMSDDLFWKELEFFFSISEYRQKKAHIQIGYHGINGVEGAKTDNSIETFSKNYERLICTVIKYIPDLTLASETNVVDAPDLPDTAENINKQLEKQNDAIKALAQKYGLKFNDLYHYMLNEGKDFKHSDKIHFESNANMFIAERIASIIK